MEDYGRRTRLRTTTVDEASAHMGPAHKNTTDYAKEEEVDTLESSAHKGDAHKGDAEHTTEE